MKQSIDDDDDDALPTSFFRANQKNQILQGQLADRQRLNYIQFVKNMKNYNSEEKYNRELLYTWKKESYIRQLKKNIQAYERNTPDVNDIYYEYQVRNLNHILTGRPGLVIPPSEVKRRLNINAKYQQFLQKYPLKTSWTSSTPANQNQNEPDEEENTRNLDKTWKHIHAQSAILSRRKQNTGLSTIFRSSTMDDIRRNKVFKKNLISPMVTDASNAFVRTDSELIDSSFDETFQRSNHLELPNSIEPLLMTSQPLDKYDGTDLVTMRSIRRPRQNPSDLNYLHESRKLLCQMNKRVLNSRSCQRKYRVEQNK